MRTGKILRLIDSWVSAGVIAKEQADKIKEYVHAESRRRVLKLIQILFVIGAFWLFFGLLAVIRLLPWDILKFLADLIKAISRPISEAFLALARRISPTHYSEALGGMVCFVAAGLFFWLALRLRKKSELQIIRLGLLQSKEFRLGTTSLVISYILLSCCWFAWNYASYPDGYLGYWGKEVLFPVFSLIGAAVFFALAYFIRDQIALLFGIGFFSQAIGMTSGYWLACYFLSVQWPIIQVLVSLILLFLGLWHTEKARDEEENFLFVFGRTYQWTGLLFLFLALWIMSVCGVSYSLDEWRSPKAAEIWAGNILFFGASVGSLFFGAFRNDRMWFNYGLTFFIIFSYTAFFSHVWATVGAGWASLLLGALLVATGYGLRELWIKGILFYKK